MRENEMCKQILAYDSPIHSKSCAQIKLHSRAIICARISILHKYLKNQPTYLNLPNRASSIISQENPAHTRLVGKNMAKDEFSESTGVY
ncbi:hypothetical protein CASFOL_040375 [Castilleja foliolosa]|uniref:Uncharacterized protein n=1 Tax=Castilleja foliolosa TaxID=1961234 RepID=A0ABD3BG79_9LAMI